MKESDNNLRIDEEFRGLIYPLTHRAYQALEESILRDGCRTPIKVWNRWILDGHNRYEICMQHGIPFTTEEKHFKRRRDVIVWLCERQLQRNDLSPQMRRYLIGIQYETQKPTSARGRISGKKAPTDQRTKRVQVMKRIGDTNHVTRFTVERYGYFARSINQIRKISPELAMMILSGDYGITHEKTVQLANGSEEDLLHFEKEILRNRLGELREQRQQSTTVSKEREGPSVKDTPTYDPDAAATGLALTIPTWCSSISRVIMAADVDAISDNAKRKLEAALQTLSQEIERLMYVVRT